MAYSADLAGSKLRAQLGASLNESASAPASAFAQRHLQKLGWTEGTGLGKHRTGRVSHVKVTKRKEQVGLGHASTTAGTSTAAIGEWWNDQVGNTLAKLSKKKKRKHVTDDDLLEATGGVRFGMRGRATAKFSRTESTVGDQDEERAKARVEWHGTGQARVILQTKSKQDTNAIKTYSSSMGETDEIKEESKKDGGKKTRKTKKNKKHKKEKKRAESSTV